MRILEYFSFDDQTHWLSEIARCDWRPGKYLYELLKTGTLPDKAGADPKVLLLTEGQELLAFCTLSEKKYDVPSPLTPWLGFVYTFPAHRGHRYAGILFRHAMALIRAAGLPGVYLSTNHENLYERYGFTCIGTATDWRNETQKIYYRAVSDDDTASFPRNI